VTADLLEVRHLSKSYRGRTVLRNVSLTLARGRTLALVGPSGSGKSTLARCIAGFEKPDAGEILLAGNTRPQLIFQQPASSLNPRFTAQEIIEEPLVIQHRDRQGAAERAMQLVSLPTDALHKRALQFSGGERQRLAIARALVLEPELLILDESFAGLDGKLQEQIAALLSDLQHRLNLAYLVISHDLELVAGLAHDLAVMEEGAIVEQGPTSQLLSAANHPLTRQLLDASLLLGQVSRTEPPHQESR
jgi:ABC-type dipeptide/oligopeptide/nickel transport system ATPase subunit